MATPQELHDAIFAAPELQNAPGLALAASSSGDPSGNAQVLAQTGQTAALNGGFNHVAAKTGHPDFLHRTLGFLGGAFHEVKNDLGATADFALHAANAGLQEVQHQYRYLHDVEARHGPLAALLEGLGIGAGAIAGGLLTIPTFGLINPITGAEAVAGAEGRLIYTDSWDRATSGANYQGQFNRQTGQYSGPKGTVSLGRDLTAHLPHPLRFISGITDGLADLTLDPLAAAGGGFAEAGKATRTISTAEDFTTALDHPVFGRGVHRAMEDIAGKTGAEIQRAYPKFAGIASELGQANTADKVIEVFRDSLTSAELMKKTSGVIPSLSLTKIPYAKMREAIQAYDGPASQALRVFKLLPVSFDPETLKMSAAKFNPADDASANLINKVVRWGQSQQVADNVSNAYLATNHLGERREIYKNAVTDMLINGRGHAEDSDFVREFVNKLDNSLGGEGVGVDVGAHGDAYLNDAAGKNLSQIPNPSGGPDYAAAGLENQVGKWALPNFSDMIRAERAQSKIRDTLGKADDFFYHYWTSAVFKRLSLLTGGFALRIAAAEAIPAVLREGFTNLVKSSVELHRGANLIDPEELNGISGAVHSMLGGLAKHMTNPQDVELATQSTLANSGHLVPAALNAGGTESGSALGWRDMFDRMIDKAYKRVPPEKRYGDKFGIWGQSPDHAAQWQASFKEAANSDLAQTAADGYLSAVKEGQTVEQATQRGAEAAKQHLDGLPENFLNQFERHFTPSVPGADPHEDWGRVVMEHVKGLVTKGSTDEAITSGAIHQDLLQHLSEGTTPELFDFEKIAPAERPMVKGRIETPPLPTSALESIANTGHEKILSPIINFLSRQPMYFNELKTQYAPLRKLIDDGVINADEALQIAQIRAVKNITPFIHNTLERSQFAVLAKNFMPFYFAQTQAYRRVGRLMADDIGAFRQYQLANSSFAEVGSNVTGADGQKNFVFPGAGFLSPAAVGILGGLGVPVAGAVPTAFSGQVKSLQTIFPFAETGGPLGPFSPKFGPLVSIPARALANFMPEAEPLVHGLLGEQAASQGIWDQLLPNTPLRNMVKALAPGSDHQRSFQVAMMNTIQSLTFHDNQAKQAWAAAGKDEASRPNKLIPAPDDGPQAQQAFIDKVRNQTRINFVLKAFISAVSPMAPSVEIGDIGLRDEVRQLIKDKGLGAGIQEFLKKNPDATPYTVFMSKSPTGAYVPATLPAEDFYNSHRSTLEKYPYAGAWLLPQPTGANFSPAVYAEQMAQRLRIQKAPDQFLNDLYVAAGNQQFYERDKKTFDQALQAARNDPEKQRTLRADFNNYLSTQLGPQNPMWWDNFKSANRDHERQMAVQQLTAMFQNGDAPPGAQTDAVRSLLGDYQVHVRSMTPGAQDSLTQDQRQAMKDDWQNYLDKLAIEKPELASIISKVFRAI